MKVILETYCEAFPGHADWPHTLHLQWGAAVGADRAPPEGPATAYWSCVLGPFPSSAALTPAASVVNSSLLFLGLFLHLTQIPVEVCFPNSIFFKFRKYDHCCIFLIININEVHYPSFCFLALPFQCYFIFCNIPLIYFLLARTENWPMRY